MIRTINVCDKCGDNSEDTPKLQFFTVSYQVEDGVVKTYQKNPYRAKKAHWCRKCVQATIGEFPKAESDPPKPDPEMNTSEKLEELIREIAYEEAAEAMSNT